MKNLLKTFASLLRLLGERVGVRAGAQTLTASLLALIILSTLTAPAASFIITATVTITNTPVVTNTFVYNSDTRTWQTNNSSTRIQATNSIAQSVTNLYQHFVTYPLVGPVSVRITTSSNLTFVSPTGTNVSITFGGSGWARVSYVTNAVATGFTVTVPDANITNRATATNISSGLIDWLKYASNTMSATAPAWTNFLTIAPNGKTFTNVLLTTPAITGGGLTNSAITNAPSISGSNIALVTGTLTNVTARMSTNINAVIQGAREISGTIGNVTNGWIIGSTVSNVTGFMSSVIINGLTVTNLSSPGSGVQAQAFGLSSLAAGDYAIAVGPSASASSNYSISIGKSSSAANDNAVAIGQKAASAGFGGVALGGGPVGGGGANGARASGDYGLALGYKPTASGFGSIALGYAATAAYTNSAAVGFDVSSAAANEFRLGNATNYFTFGGPIFAPTLSNMVHVGNSTNSSSWTENSSSVTTLANGHNNVAISDSTSFVKLSGPSAAFYIDGLTNGWTDRVLALRNDSDYTMTIANESGLVPAVNRIATPDANDFPVTTNSTVLLKYLSSRWTIIGGTPSVSTNTYATVASVRSLTTTLVETNSTGSNVTINFAQPSTEIYFTNNLSLTNYTGLSLTEPRPIVIHFLPQLINRTVIWPTLGAPGNGVYWKTNANSNMHWTTLTNGIEYVLAIHTRGTNIYPMLSEWK